jgi:hypothetical protein
MDKTVLRISTHSLRPGTYFEEDVPALEKPAFFIPDPTFDSSLPRHCAFPSLSVNHPTPGPSEAIKAAREGERHTEVMDGPAKLPEEDVLTGSTVGKYFQG